MNSLIVLDSTPLSLLTQRAGVAAADECRRWAARHAANGVRLLLPEIIDYELRRELLRLNRTASIARLDVLVRHPQMSYQPLSTGVLKLAASLWANARQRGVPTADPQALDIDAILAAQALSAGVATTELVVATSNVGHLAQFVPAKRWQDL